MAKFDQIEELQFLFASPDQSSGITGLVNSVYRGENSKKGWTTEAHFLTGIRITADEVSEIINSDNNVIMLALLESKIIGCVHLEKEAECCWLGLLSVDVSVQAHGIGKIMIEKSESFARDTLGCNEMKMKVIGIRSELIEYYKRRGYYPTGEKEDFNTAADAFGVPLKKHLYFEILSKKL